MSWKATAHVKELTHAPNGKAVTRSEKLLLLIIADYYNDEKQCAWASVPTIAKNALLTDRRVRQVIKNAEEKGILQVTHRSGRSSVYRLPTLTPEIISPLKSEAPTPEIFTSPLKPAAPPPLKPAAGELIIEPQVLEPSENTHGKMGVYSKFSLDECRRYARWLHDTRQGVDNPEGFAKSCYYTAHDDARIRDFLRDEAAIRAAEQKKALPPPGCDECGKLEACGEEVDCWLVMKAKQEEWKREGAA